MLHLIHIQNIIMYSFRHKGLYVWAVREDFQWEKHNGNAQAYSYRYSSLKYYTEFGLITLKQSNAYSRLSCFCSWKDVFLRCLWQEVCDAVYAAETHAVDPWEGGGSELSPVRHQSLHTSLHEPPHAPQTPRGEKQPHAARVNDITDSNISLFFILSMIIKMKDEMRDENDK